ncbi:MAG: FtsW/RodA/SpoVE family cell cycle protein [Acidimicrobiales bacterium]
MPRLLRRDPPTGVGRDGPGQGVASDSQRRFKPARRTELGLIVFGCLLVVAAYVLATVGTTAKIPGNLGIFLAIVLGLALVAHVATRRYAPDASPVMLPLVVLLNGLGYVMVASIDAHYAKLQAAWTAAGVVFYVLALVVVKRSRDLDRYRYLLLLAGAALLLAPLVPHVGEDINGARLWVHVGPINGQPVEVAKIFLCIFFASYFVEKREMLSVPTMRLGNRLVIDPRPAGPIIVAWLFAMVILGGENDIGFTLMIFVLFVLMLWIATGRLAWLVVGLIMFAVGAFVASHLFAQVNYRVEDWLDPWSKQNYDRPLGSFQIVQSQYSFGNGGLLGTGLGYGFWGSPPLFTTGELATDYIFIVFGQEMGLIGTSVIVAAFLLVVGAGLQIAQRARTEFSSLAATGLTAILGVQAFIIMAGLVRLLPLTGITLPFMAYGGSSLVANYIIVAFLMRISDEGNRSIITAAATATRVQAAAIN